MRIKVLEKWAGGFGWVVACIRRLRGLHWLPVCRTKHYADHGQDSPQQLLQRQAIYLCFSASCLREHENELRGLPYCQPARKRRETISPLRSHPSPGKGRRSNNEAWRHHHRER
ncbi:unnamed protein product [Peronospora belbahrii]|uniref:Uncharacterized protein n=1 Tax=Peronospora belbahrii TaxID=622444 RepID=A0AAU9KYG6_9STRA|nr:unnamed protein product [Peronospora belbahrii]